MWFAACCVFFPEGSELAAHRLIFPASEWTGLPWPAARMLHTLAVATKGGGKNQCLEQKAALAQGD